MSAETQGTDMGACTAAILTAYADAGKLIEDLKVKRAKERIAPPPRLLDEAVECAPHDIEREKERGKRFGQAFDKCDETAIAALHAVADNLRRGLVEPLEKVALHDDDPDLRHLVDVADSGRDQTVDTLIQLRQRLLTAESNINRKVQSVSTQPHSPSDGQSSSPKDPAAKAHQSKHDARHNLPPRLLHPSSDYRDLSKDASGDEDAVSGAEHSHRKRRGGSLLGFLKHHRAHSHGDRQVERHGFSSSESLVRTNQITSSPSSGPVQAPQPDEHVPSSGGRSDRSASQSSVWLYRDDDDDRPENDSHNGDESPSLHRESSASVETVRPRSTSDSGARTRQPSLATNLSRASSTFVPTPSHDNDYLGFCKSAVRLQNGDKKALEKRREFNDGWSHSTVHYLACSSHKCVFAGRLNLDSIMTKVWIVESKNLKFRWPFLAKSHVVQHKVKDQAYAYQCLFCVYSREKSPIFHGMNDYVDHIQTHRGKSLNDAVLYKVKCISDRICDDDEDFDINLYPLSLGELRDRRASGALSDDLLGFHLESKPTEPAIDSNAPWNEGLSDFHYRDEFERG